MRIIAITSPKVIEDDVFLIQRLLEKGIDTIHLRKPDSGIHECRKLLEALASNQRSKIIIHDYPELYKEFSLKGIHVNKNVPCLPSDYKGYRTSSCHSLEEVQRYKNEYDYVFLSPIFDSISKVGYRSGLTKEELLEASAAGIIDEKVIALGGVTFDKIPYLKTLNFGGAAMIGGIYHRDALCKLNHGALIKKGAMIKFVPNITPLPDNLSDDKSTEAW